MLECGKTKTKQEWTFISLIIFGMDSLLPILSEYAGFCLTTLKLFITPLLKENIPSHLKFSFTLSVILLQESSTFSMFSG
jgi:hypothetical protein